MNVPPIALAAVVLLGGVAGWLYLGKDADVEQRMDKREAIHARESAAIDKDFASIVGDKQGASEAEARIASATVQVEKADAASAARAKTDKRSEVREAFNQFLTPDEKAKKDK